MSVLCLVLELLEARYRAGWSKVNPPRKASLHTRIQPGYAYRIPKSDACNKYRIYNIAWEDVQEDGHAEASGQWWQSARTR